MNRENIFSFILGILLVLVPLLIFYGMAQEFNSASNSWNKFFCETLN